MKKNERLRMIYPVFMTVLTYLPILIVVVWSFNESKLSSVWAGFSLKWYRELFADRSMLSALGTSLFLGAVSSVLAAVIAVSAALSMERARLPFLGAVEKIMLTPMIIPEIVLGMIFLAYFSLLHLPFGMLTLLIAHIAFSIPYIYMEVRAALSQFDPQTTEAARDLGAGAVTAFFTVTLPMLSPAIISGMFLSFAMSFDDVIISIFVTGVNVNTLPIKVYTQLKTGLSPKINALCSLMLAVTLLCSFTAFLIRRRTAKKREISGNPENNERNGIPS